jgi:PAS domain S-box-containing protein
VSEIGILLIEDNPGDVLLLLEQLNELDNCYRITNAIRLQEGIDYLNKEKFDLVLLDLWLPDCSGMDTLRKLKQHISDIPVVILSELSDEQTGLLAIQEGAEDYLIKGEFNAQILDRTLRYAVLRWHSEALRREGERNYYRLFENMNEGLAQFDIIYDDNCKPVDYKITDVNPAFESITGIKNEGVIGQKVSSLYKIGLPPYLDIFARVAETGQPTTFEAYFKPLKKHLSFSVFSPGKGRFAAVFSDIDERKRLEERLAYLASFPELNPMPIVEVAKSGDIIYANPAARDEFPDLEHLGYQHPFLSGLQGDEVTEQTNRGPFNREIKVGERYYGQVIPRIVKNKEKRIYSIDITESYKLGLELKQDEARLESLLKIATYRTSDVKSLLDFALNEAITLTRSKIGYIHFYDEDKKEITLTTWSQDVMKECQLLVPQTTCELEKIGMWGEAVRQRKPVILNDFSSPHPPKKGYPQGHVELQSFLTVPVFTSDRIVALVGVANKTSEYVSSDIRQLTLLMDAVWKMVDQKKAEQALRESEEHLRRMVSSSPVPIVVYNHHFKFELLNDRFVKTFGYTLEDLPDIESWWEKAYPDKQYRDKVILAWRNAADTRVPGTGTSQSPESHITCKDGSQRIAFASRTILGDKYLVAFTDITERTRYEEDLQNGINKLHVALRGTIDATAKMVEMRDPYTGGHQERVAKLSTAIAREMGLSDEQIMYTGLAAMVHDVGKIYIPAEILSRTGTLTELEYKFVKTHVQGGYDILKTIEFPWPIAQIVYQHHERLDGSGYPRNLKGEEILLEARVLGVADTVEAMGTHRPYRPARGLGEALEEISRNKGKLYDEKVVEACVTVFLEKGFRFDEEHSKVELKELDQSPRTLIKY